MEQSFSEYALEFLYRIKGDLLFALLLIVCLLISLALRKLALLGFKQNLDGFIGLAITLVASGSLFWCSLLVVFSHLVLYKLVKDPIILSNISFYGTFAYLAVLRVIHFVGLPPLIFIANSIQLIMTLRVIGLSYEIADARLAKLSKAADETDRPIHSRFIQEPSTLEAFNYCYSFTGLFTGPYYTYQTYYDALHCTHFIKELPKTLVYEKISKLYWSLPLLIAFSWLNPVDVLRGDKINEYRVLSLFVWSALAFIYFRMRIYTAWMIAESICVIAGVGVYPASTQPQPGSGPKLFEGMVDMKQHPENVQLSAETINNLDISHIEHSDGFRSGMRAWNRTVQFWLANFVYRRTKKSIRMEYTMLISAFWHGIHPGYFFSFLTIPLCTAAEDVIFRVYPAEKRPAWFSILWSFVRMRAFESMACGFLLLNFADTVRLWANMYFWLHITMLVTIVYAKVCLATSTKQGSAVPKENRKEL